MEGILYGYYVSDETWFYLSLLLIVAVLFRFGRMLSLRNLDLILLLSLSPGLLLLTQQYKFGISWLLSGSGVILIRLFCDSLLTRRPRLEPNLNAAGLAFLGAASFLLLMTKAMTEQPPDQTVETVRRSNELLGGRKVSPDAEPTEAGPISPILATPAAAVSSVVSSGEGSFLDQFGGRDLLAAKTMAVLAHLAVIAALYVMGRIHFNDTRAGVAMATIYLLLPCTSYDVGKVNHVLPAALIAWAFVFHHRPMIAGSFMGLACGTLFFPAFLLPLWISFYPTRGKIRFGLPLILISAIVLGSFAYGAADQDSFMRKTLSSINLSIIPILSETDDATGFWNANNKAYLIPVFVAYLVMLFVLTAFPRKKTIEHLMAHSAALIVGIQFWYPRDGGVYLLWYLPLLLMVIMRPRLAHLTPPEAENAESPSRSHGNSTPKAATANGTVPGSRLFR